MPLSVVDIFQKILPKTNCREGGHPTCLAFAGMVVSEQLPLKKCPHIEPGVLESAHRDAANKHIMLAASSKK